jgi:uncharacterized protein
MLHPHTELRQVNTEIGLGVFATHFIPKGTITWVRDTLDRVLTPDRFKTMPPIYTERLFKYTFRDTKGNHILCWDAGRFLNHSCEPTCMGYGIDFEIAIRDIYPNEELTNDYMSLNPYLDEAFRCQCGTPSCRDWVCYDDLKTNTDEWIRLMRQAFAAMESVSQPLWSLLPFDEIERATQFLNIQQSKIGLRKSSVKVSQ